MATYDSQKRRLHESFLSSKERGLTDEQVQWAKDCVHLGQYTALSDKYKILPFGFLLQQNNNNYIKLNNALGLILQYITDLLSPELPPNWWSISTRNTSYAYRVKNVVGVEDVFKLAGYTKRSNHFLAFPEGDRTKPDRGLLADLATEILLAREECSAAADGRINPVNTHGASNEMRGPSSRSRGQPFTEVHYRPHHQYENVSVHPSMVTSCVDRHSTGESLGFAVSSTVASPNPFLGELFSQTNNNPSDRFENGSTQGQVDVTSPTPSQPPIPKPRTNIQRRIDSTSSGSPTSSPSNSSGLLLDSPSPDKPKEDSSLPKGEPGSNSTMKKRREALKKKLEQANKATDPDAPLLDPTPQSFSTPKETLLNDPSAPTPTTRGVSRTSVDPSRPLNFGLHFGSEKISEADESIDEQNQPATPFSPKKCPTCQGHLNESSICTYCNSLPLPLEVPTPKPHPVPKPRKRRPMTEVQSPRALNPTDIPSQNNPGQGLSPIHEPKESPEPSKQSDKLEGATPLPVTDPQPSENPVESEALQQQYDKYISEADHFNRMSLEEQDDYLDDKIRVGQPVNHLKPRYKGREWFGRKEKQELDYFDKLSPEEQKKLIEEKRSKGEKVSHHLLMSYNGPYIGQRPFELDQGQHLRQQRQEKAKSEGKYFCECIKTCSKHGFSPKEVEIALKYGYQDPLGYLQQEWKKCIDEATLFVSYNRVNVGKPSYEEVRRHLIEAKGNFREAGRKCVANRVNKIRELEKLCKNIKHNRQLLIDCLNHCEFVVEEAFYELQRRGLTSSELYRYLTGDYIVSVAPSKGHTEEAGTDGTSDQEKGKTEMDLMKDKVLERIKDKEKNKEAYNACIRMLMAENKFKEKQKALMLVRLLQEKSDYPMKYYIDATKHYDNYEDALKFLNQPCSICMDTYIMDDMVVMPACGDALCKHCFIGHFSLVIKEKTVKHFNCPMCSKPDLSNPDETQDMNIELFVALVKEFLDKECYELCQQKLTDFNLSKSPNFVWCINEKCRSGFLTDREDRIRVECPHCHLDMCFLCRKKWEHQHEGLTCDQFTQWKIDNDPEAQKQGLAAHLAENGIQCPSCRFRYDLARGGCMHFRCTQCPIEFCSGCYGTIKKGQDCGKFEACKGMGLHAHHPRDCLFYLRDFSVTDLQGLLTANEVEFDQDPPKAQVDAAREGKEENKEQLAVEDIEDVEEAPPQVDEEAPVEAPPPQPVALTCCVMLQKEGPEGLYDEKCGEAAPNKMAGLCETHYKEYLVSKINKHKLDPLELYTLHQLKRILEREEKEVPEKNNDELETDDDYKKRLIDHIKEELPLQLKGNQPVVAPE